MAKTHTSTEVKQRWMNENYKRFVVSFRYDSDKEIIDYIGDRKKQGDQTSEIFREAMEALIETEK